MLTTITDVHVALEEGSVHERHLVAAERAGQGAAFELMMAQEALSAGRADRDWAAEVRLREHQLEEAENLLRRVAANRALS